MALRPVPFSPHACAQAVARLQAGKLVALPTETVYGLAADADQDAAVARIFAAKGRPTSHPLIVHLAGPGGAHWQTALERYSLACPDYARRLQAAFWPGPLTLILPRRPGVAGAAAGQQDSIALRCPAHPVAQQLLGACRAVGIWGLAAPSANRFGRLSPTCAGHVVEELGAVCAAEQLLILDGGPCAVGIESSIVDCTRERPALLRPGVLTLAALEAAAGMPLVPADAGAPRASGTLGAHYAPRAPLRLLTAGAMQSALNRLGAGARQLALYSRSPLYSASPQVLYQRMAPTPQACAQELFAVLRALDQADTRQIWVEAPPPDSAWDGVRDRLQRAAAAG